MYSFYGGKQGLTYHIVERFDELYFDPNDKISEENPNGRFTEFESGATYSIGQELLWNNRVYIPIVNGTLIESDLADTEKVTLLKAMVNLFQRGGAYTDVNYGLYVIIDTILKKDHKSDDTNGLLYRRGMDYTQAAIDTDRPNRNDSKYYDGTTFLQLVWSADWINYITNPGGGAIYIGQIVGPKGDSPLLIAEDWDTYINTHLHPSTSTVLLQGVPGIYKEDSSASTYHFRDDIRFGSATMKDADGDVTGAHVSFEFPYTSFRVTATEIPPIYKELDEHGAPTSVDINIPVQHILLNREDSDIWSANSSHLVHDFHYNNEEPGVAHPYFHDIQLAIPHGKHGTDISTISTRSTGGLKYFYYKTTSYDDVATGTISDAINIAPYRVINNMSTVESLRTLYRNYLGLFRLYPGDIYISNYEEIDPLTLLTVQRKIQFICTSGGLIDTLWIRENVSFLTEGTTIQTVDEDYIPDALNPMASLLVINLPEPAAAALLTHFTATIEGTNTKIHTVDFNNLDYIYTSQDGSIYVVYTNTDDSEINPETAEGYHNNPRKIGQLKQILEVNYHNGLDENGTLEIKYNMGDDYISLSNNMVIGLDQEGDNIILLYSNADFRKAYMEDSTHTEGIHYFLKQYNEEMKKKFNLHLSTDEGEDFLSYDGDDGQGNIVWINLGPIGLGYHVDGNYTIAQVREEIPEGFVGANQEVRAGWIISVSATLGGDVLGLYAYDYRYARDKVEHPETAQRTAPTEDYLTENDTEGSELLNWYKIKDLSNNSIPADVSVYLGNELNQTNLNLGGLAFVTTMTHSHLES